MPGRGRCNAMCKMLARRTPGGVLRRPASARSVRMTAAIVPALAVTGANGTAACRAAPAHIPVGPGGNWCKLAPMRTGVRRVWIALGVLATVVLGLGAWLYTPDKPRAALEALYAGPPSQFVEAAGMRLHVRDTGPRDAPALLLLHGFGASLHTWDALAARLEGNCRVVRLDLPGFGLTGPDPARDYSDARSHAVLMALMDRLGVARAAVAGHSMGGRIAWTLAASHPERVDRLVLLAPDGFASPGFEYGTAPKVPPLLRLLPYVMPTFLLRASLQPAYADPAMVTDAMVTRYRDMLLAPGVRGAILDRTAQAMLADPVPLLRRIAVPVLLLWGAEDRMIPARNADAYLAALPDARRVAFPGVGHVLHEEAADETAAAMQKFLAQQR